MMTAVVSLNKREYMEASEEEWVNHENHWGRLNDCIEYDPHLSSFGS